MRICGGANLWWTGELDDAPAYLAWGFGGQVIRVVLDRDLVVVLSSSFPDGETGMPPTTASFLTDEVIAPLFADWVQRGRGAS